MGKQSTDFRTRRISSWSHPCRSVHSGWHPTKRDKSHPCKSLPKRTNRKLDQAMGILLQNYRPERDNHKSSQLIMRTSLLLTLITSIPYLSLADWRGFRGTDGNGLIASQISPDLSLKNEKSWRIDLPGRGLSSPIIVGELIFLTASSGPQQKNLHVIAFNSLDGKKVWERIFRATGRTICHQKTCVAASTMVSDGRSL